MSPDDFSFIAKLLKERSGLSIGEDKVYLLESRLMPVVRKNGFASIDELIASIKGKNIALAEEVTEAMTTNESFFFRDTKPFDQFKQIVLPAMLKERAGKKVIRIWCAAASSGQEPYSLAMILNEEKAKLEGWRIEIVGTDISRDILQKAKEGKYSQFEVQRGLPVNLLVKYFTKQDENWIISQEIRSMVNYKYWNLLDDISPLGVFDVVFCRNVLIYFDHPTKSKVLAKIANQLAGDGFLYLGGAETVLGISNRFKPVPGQRGVYVVNAAGNDALPAGFVPTKQPLAAGATTVGAATAGAAGVAAARPTTSPLGTRPTVPAGSSYFSKTPLKSPLVKRPISQPLGSRPAGTPINSGSNITNRPLGTGIGSGGTPVNRIVSPTRPTSPTTPTQQSPTAIKKPIGSASAINPAPRSVIMPTASGQNHAGHTVIRRVVTNRIVPNTVKIEESK